MVREVVSNVIRHSNSKRLTIAADIVSGKVRITFEDDGLGFPERVLKDELGFGLKGIKKRVLDLGGECRFENLVRGTFIQISFPI